MIKSIRKKIIYIGIATLIVLVGLLIYLLLPQRKMLEESQVKADFLKQYHLGDMTVDSATLELTLEEETDKGIPVRIVTKAADDLGDYTLQITCLYTKNKENDNWEHDAFVLDSIVMDGEKKPDLEQAAADFKQIVGAKDTYKEVSVIDWVTDLDNKVCNININYTLVRQWAELTCKGVISYTFSDGVWSKKAWQVPDEVSYVITAPVPESLIRAWVQGNNKGTLQSIEGNDLNNITVNENGEQVLEITITCLEEYELLDATWQYRKEYCFNTEKGIYEWINKSDGDDDLPGDPISVDYSKLKARIDGVTFTTNEIDSTIDGAACIMNIVEDGNLTIAITRDIKSIWHAIHFTAGNTYTTSSVTENKLYYFSEAYAIYEILDDTGEKCTVKLKTNASSVELVVDGLPLSSL